MSRAKSGRVMTCWQCPRYDRTERRCRDGKTNPKRQTDAVAVVELLGLRALCHYCPHREPLVSRWHFPKQSVAAVPLDPMRHLRRPHVEIEFENSESEG